VKDFEESHSVKDVNERRKLEMRSERIRPE
jgi:hypothetical protein